MRWRHGLARLLRQHCGVVQVTGRAPDSGSAGPRRRRTVSTEPLILLHAAGEQEDFRPLFLPGPPALVLWSGAVPRGLSQSNVRQNATVCIRGEPAHPFLNIDAFSKFEGSDWVARPWISHRAGRES